MRPWRTIASRALTARLARIWSTWEGSILTVHRLAASSMSRRDLLADQATEHLGCRGHGLVQVQAAWLHRLPAREGEELPRQVTRSRGGTSDLEYALAVVGRQPGAVDEQLDVAEDRLDHVVEVVGHAARESPHRLHLLCLEELLLETNLVAFSLAAFLQFVLSLIEQASVRHRHRHLTGDGLQEQRLALEIARALGPEGDDSEHLTIVHERQRRDGEQATRPAPFPAVRLVGPDIACVHGPPLTRRNAAGARAGTERPFAQRMARRIVWERLDLDESVALFQEQVRHIGMDGVHDAAQRRIGRRHGRTSTSGSSRHLAQTRQLVDAALERFFGPTPFGDGASESDDARRPVVIVGRACRGQLEPLGTGRHLERVDRAPAPPVGPRVSEGLLNDPRRFRWQQLVDPSAGGLGRIRVEVLAKRRAKRDDAIVLIEFEEEIREGVQGGFEALIGRLQHVLGSLARRDVAERAVHATRRGSLLVLDRPREGGDPHRATVLPAEPKLTLTGRFRGELCDALEEERPILTQHQVAPAPNPHQFGFGVAGDPLDRPGQPVDVEALALSLDAGVHDVGDRRRHLSVALFAQSQGIALRYVFGDVEREDHPGGSTVPDQFMRTDLHVQQTAVARSVAPARGSCRSRECREQIVLETPKIFGRTDVHERHREELVARVAVTLHGCVVHRQKPQRLEVVHPHRMRVGFEQLSVRAVGHRHLVYHSSGVGRIHDRGPPG